MPTRRDDGGGGRMMTARPLPVLMIAVVMVMVRDVIFRKMTNQNQIDTNEMTNTETKYQTDFILPQNTNI